MSQNSLCLCRCGACGLAPGFRVVSWTSTCSPVGVVPWVTLRTSPEPLALGRGFRSSNAKLPEVSVCSSEAHALAIRAKGNTEQRLRRSICMGSILRSDRQRIQIASLPTSVFLVTTYTLQQTLDTLFLRARLRQVPTE